MQSESKKRRFWEVETVLECAGIEDLVPDLSSLYDYLFDSYHQRKSDETHVAMFGEVKLLSETNDKVFGPGKKIYRTRITFYSEQRGCFHVSFFPCGMDDEDTSDLDDSYFIPDGAKQGSEFIYRLEFGQIVKLWKWK